MNCLYSFLAVSLLTASADTPPAAPTGVADGAGLLSSDQIGELNGKIEALRKDHNFEVRIVTEKAVPIDKRAQAISADPSIKSAFYQAWAKEFASQSQTKGILLLICTEPRHFHYAITDSKHFSPKDGDHLNSIVLAQLRKDRDYDKALNAGLDSIANALRQHAHGPASADAKPQPRANHGGNSLLGFLCMGLAIFGIFWIVIGLIRSFSVGGSGGGNFFTGLLGGLFGVMAGSWIFNNFFGGNSSFGGHASDNNDWGHGGDDFGGGGDFGGGDFGGGGDF